MGISENIKKLRQIYGLTQDQLAEIAGVSKQAVSTWEVGTKEPRMGAIEKMSTRFGLKKSNLIEDDGLTPKRIAESLEGKDKVVMGSELLDLINDENLMYDGKKLDPERKEILINIIKAYLK